MGFSLIPGNSMEEDIISQSPSLILHPHHLQPSSTITPALQPQPPLLPLLLPWHHPNIGGHVVFGEFHKILSRIFLANQKLLVTFSKITFCPRALTRWHQVSSKTTWFLVQIPPRLLLLNFNLPSPHLDLDFPCGPNKKKNCIPRQKNIPEGQMPPTVYIPSL